MKWGEYLCRGTSPVLPKYNDTTVDTDTAAAFEKLSSKVEQALKNLGLSNFSSSVAKQYLIGKLNDGKADKLTHVIGYVVDLLNKKKTKMSTSVNDTTQSGCPNVIPGLRAQPYWDTNNFPWIQQLEACYDTIKDEFMSLRSLHGTESGGNFQHYRSPRASSEEECDDLGALATSKDFKDNQGMCPQTINAINCIPRHYHHAMFSALAPDTHVKPHYGPTNKKLRCHLPLYIPKNSRSSNDSGSASSSGQSSAGWIKVAGETRYLQEGKAVVFDDSFLHEAGNTSLDQPRVVLIVDVWHPDLTEEEVHFLDFINKAQIKAAQKLSQLSKELSSVSTSVDKSASTNGGPPAEEEYGDFFQVIQKAKSVGITERDYSSIWGTNVGE